MTDTKMKYVPNPTAALFHKNDATVRLLYGAISCGKKVIMFQEIMAKVNAAPDDGKLRCYAIVCPYVRPMREVTITAFLDWFPPGEYDKMRSFSKMEFSYKIGDNTRIDFLAMDVKSSETKLRWGNYHGVCFLNFCDIEPAVFERAIIRRHHSDGSWVCGVTVPQRERDTDDDKTKARIKWWRERVLGLVKTNWFIAAIPNSDNIRWLPGGERYYERGDTVTKEYEQQYLKPSWE